MWWWILNLVNTLEQWFFSQLPRRLRRRKSEFSQRELNPEADLGGGCRGCAPPLPEMTCGFLIQLVFCPKKNYVVYWCWSRARDECTPSWKKSWIHLETRCFTTGPGEYMQQVSIIMLKLSITVLRSSGVYFHFVGNIFPKIGGIFRGSMFALNLYKVLHSRSWHSCFTPWVCRQWIYNSSVWISSCICGKNSDPLCKECSVTGGHLGFESIKSI